MKKLLVLLSLTAIVLTSCKKDDLAQKSGFSVEEQKVLEVLNGTFKYEQIFLGSLQSTTTITFTPFAEPTSKTNPINNLPIKFDGIMKHLFVSSASDSNDEGNDSYFYLNVEQEKIFTNSVVTNPDEYNFYLGKEYDYEIVDENTIHLVGTNYTGSRTFKRVE